MVLADRAVWQHRHCERSEAIQLSRAELDCFVASLPATTDYTPAIITYLISTYSSMP
jgi:hypothetical protein